MPDQEMNLSVNGQSQVPPGFRFHPTEEELLHYYLRKKVASKKIDLDVIRDVDLNKLEPWDIQERCRIGSTPQNDWYFFSHKDKKYPTGTRTNRATAAGFWKATGRDKVIYSNSKRIGMRKTLVFYIGRAPHGQKSDWIVHEYRLDDNNDSNAVIHHHDINPPEDGWVVCRVFKKKNYHKALESSRNSTTSMDSRNRVGLINSSISPGNDNIGILDRILVYMGRTCKQENGTITSNSTIFDNNDDSDSMQFMINNPVNNSSITADSSDGLRAKFMHLPGLLENPINPTTAIDSSSFSHDCPSFGANCEQSIKDMIMIRETAEDPSGFSNINGITTPADQDPKVVRGGLRDWVALDRLVASQLNGQAGADHDSCREDEVFCIPLEHEHQIQQGTYLTSNLRSSSTRPSNIDRQEDPASDDHVYMMNNQVDFWSFARPSSSSSSDLYATCQFDTIQ
ncbi:hypothetical protein ACH5RR_038237 [Cinchona calisaya]|uniref:NAC domain-containing protein n=1 Tax=Cinchona calisaya TaxID=153742 RepID=A0ABD2Y0H7_9GENT